MAKHFLLLRTCLNALLALANMAPQCGHAPGTDPLTEKHINALASKTSCLSSWLNSLNSVVSRHTCLYLYLLRSNIPLSDLRAKKHKNAKIFSGDLKEVATRCKTH